MTGSHSGDGEDTCYNVISLETVLVGCELIVN